MKTLTRRWLSLGSLVVFPYCDQRGPLRPLGLHEGGLAVDATPAHAREDLKVSYE